MEAWNGLICCEILTGFFFLLISIYVIFVITENNSEKKTGVTFPPFSEHSKWSRGKSLRFSDLTMISEYGWCFQGKFCFVLFCFHDVLGSV